MKYIPLESHPLLRCAPFLSSSQGHTVIASQFKGRSVHLSTWDSQSNISLCFWPTQLPWTHTSPLIIYFPIQKRSNKHVLHSVTHSSHTCPSYIKSNKMWNGTFQSLDCKPHMSRVSTQLRRKAIQVSNSRLVERAIAALCVWRNVGEEVLNI